MLPAAYPKEVTEWMQIVEKTVLSNPELSKENIDKLEAYSNEKHDEYLKGYALFFRGFLAYVGAMLKESMELFSEALNRLIGGENWKLATKAYNAMGNVADYQGDMSLAIDCYLKGLNMSREYGLLAEEYDISSNIGNIYSALTDYENAVRMFEECERITDGGYQVSRISEAIVQANLAYCYIQTKKYEKAFAKLEQLKKLTEVNRSQMDLISICILEIELYHALGDDEKRDAAICTLQQVEFNSMNVYDALTELCRYALLLLEIGKLEEFLSIVDRIDSLANTPSVEQQVLDLRMSYYEKVGDEANYAKMAVRSYKVARQRDDEHNKIVSYNITARMHLEEEENRRKEVEKSNLLLKRKSESDALTGMNNRYKLNELAELAFHRAYLNGTPLTFEILDIDCFKEFNDNYGHQAGDECLVRIAEAIRSLEEFDGVHTARYGGDEFVIIYEDYSKQDVEKMAKRLMDKVYSLNIEHKYSKIRDRVSISQGLFHRVPSGGNKPWDFLHGADMALYSVKKRSKNGFFVGSSYEEIRTYANGK